MTEQTIVTGSLGLEGTFEPKVQRLMKDGWRVVPGTAASSDSRAFIVLERPVQARDDH